MLTKPAPVLHCDWLQLHLKRVDKLKADFHPRYRVKTLDFSTRHFKLIQEIYYNNRRICTITSKPHSGILDPDSLIVKFDNWLLYDKSFRPQVNEFISLNGFYFIACSRVDFCADFNVFDNGMHPETFIRKYIYRKMLKEGKARNIRHTFDQGAHKHESSGLKFGSNLSEVTYYLYNKSKELREVANKPWIVATWVKGGLNTSVDVWRLEFSLKSGTKLLLDESTGEVNLFASLDILKREYISKCFFVLYQKYFQFHWNDNKSRKDRMRLIKLFSFTPCDDVLIDTTHMRDGDRATKIFIKKLHELNNEMRGRDFYMSIEMDKYKEILIHDTGLNSWAMHKGLN